MKSTIVAGALLASTCLSVASPVRGQDPSFQIQWGTCPGFSPPNLECGQLQVPVDWSSPDGESITIGLSRVNATNPAAKIGSLIYNPGGPGVAVNQICLGQAFGVPLFSQALSEHFDIICPDPRGVGTSTPVKCDPEVWNEGVSLFPSTEAEFEELVAANKAKGDSCLNLTGALLKHMDTISVAKDFEALRIALDDGRLNYLGMSYGSFIGVTYAELYPANIRAMAIDAILDHTQPTTTTSNSFVQAITYENALDRFFEWCASNATACGFVGEDLPSMFDDLIAAADRTPIPAPGCLNDSQEISAGTCRPNVTGEDIRFTANGFLMSTDGGAAGYLPKWSDLGLALNQSISGNNATLFSSRLALSDTDPLYPTTVIPCLEFDRIDTSDMARAFAQLKTGQILGNAFNKHVGSASQAYGTQASCLGWPVKVVNPQKPLNQTALQKAPPILMVNADHDPSTSYAWALSVEAQIPNAVLVTREGDGHTSYFSHGEAAGLMDTYLVNRTLPELGTVVQS